MSETKPPTIPLLLRSPRFIVAAHDPAQWPPDDAAEVAFSGRSNVGKSSALNAITQRRGLARTSKTPGRTQQIIFFELAPSRYLVDLPGYGYAKVPPGLKRHWEQVLEHYLRSRNSLRGLILLMDARHPLMPLDMQMLAWCSAAAMPVHVLLTKCDKLSRSRCARVRQEVGGVTKRFDIPVSIQLFSAVTHVGLDEARRRITEWLD